MKRSLLLALSLALGLVLAPVAGAQRLRHVRVEAPGAEALATNLENAGFDVVEGSVRESSLELIVSDPAWDDLVLRGLSFELIAEGRPYRDIQADLLGEPEPDLPPPAGYADLAGVYAKMQASAASFPAICEYVDLTNRYGTPPTHQGRHMFAVKISDNVSADEDEPAFLVVSAHHCRELVTPVIAQEAIDRLTQGYATDPAIRALVDKYEIWIAPVWNPDGYQYVFDVNNLWRKNRRPTGNNVGIDLNRNYPFGWSRPCAGSSNPGSDTYKGPSPGSEAETMTMMAFSEAERFAKVIDYHSSGREVLWEYSCTPHPLTNYLRSEAIALSQASTYNGANRAPSAEGEHYEWQLATYGNHAFLIETHTSFQPTFASAQTEAGRVWNGLEWFLEQPIPVQGHVTDVTTGLPVAASISFKGIVYPNGETNTADPATGRYHAFLPPGPYIVTYSAPGYRPRREGVFITAGAGVVVDTELFPAGSCLAARVENRNPAPNVQALTATPPVLGQQMTLTADTNGFQFATVFGYSGPALRPLEVAGWVLMDVTSINYFMIGPLPGPIAVTTVNVPNNLALCGLAAYSQAKLHNTSGPFAASNSQDLFLGL